MKILFILKQNSYGYSYGCGYGTTGLLNSAKFVVDMLADSGIHAKLVVVNDNNDIDREVHQHQPDIVIIEALWVVPEKFVILKALHPKVRWIVRVHSDLPFLQEEGIAVDWIFKYLRGGIEVAFNSKKVFKAFLDLYHDPHILYLPNYYPPYRISRPRDCSNDVYIGCFGAIRPLKNMLTQAVAAILYADSVYKRLRFFVNSSRCEQGGDNVLKNLRGLFHNTGHVLEEVPWMNHKEFIRFVGYMDIVICASFTETFCITAADAVVAGAGLVCSPEIPWADSYSMVPATDVDKISARIKKINSWSGKKTSQHLNLRGLKKFSDNSKRIWLKLLGRKKSLLARLWEY